MPERVRTIATASLIAVMGAVLLILMSPNPAHEDRVAEIGSAIRCPVCQGESIANSPSQMAEDMMDLVAERVAAGATDQEIIDELLASYTGALLLDPPPEGNTLLLWLAPALALLAGIVVIYWWKRHPGKEAPSGSAVTTRSRSRLIAGGALLVAAFAGIVVVAANSLQDRVASVSGVADVSDQDLSDVSNETMEAVIAANADNSQVNGMRLALAERYFEARDYRAAFPHYLTVAEDPGATSAEAVTALVRLGWMAYDGNGEVETATRLMDEALAIDPESDVAVYVRARVRWCGAGEADEAVTVFRGLLEDPDLPAGTRAQIESDLSLAENGEECP
jgi:cytochrome c-type biogenesis protein CcmH/NrfF